MGRMGTAIRRLGALGAIGAVALGGCDDAPVRPRSDGSFLIQHQQAADWSRQGLIAYQDNGVTAISSDGFGYHVDTTLAGVWVIDPDSGEKHRVLPFGCLCPSWSPDCQHIAFQFREAIYQARADGTQVIRLTYFEDECYLPAWSPDGNWIAYDMGWRIWIVLAGTTLSYPIGERGGAKNAAWSPDGTMILHDRVQISGSIGACLFLVSVEDGRIQPIVPVPRAPSVYRETSGVYSPSGDRIAFMAKQENHLSDIWVMNADGSDAWRLTTGGAGKPSWSPDGKRIVYDRLPTGPYDPKTGVLWIADLETGEHRQLTYHWPLTIE